MKTLLWWVTLLIVTVTTAWAQQAQPGYRISGVVVDAVTKAPVPGAEVSMSVDAEETKATTGEDGKFVFEDVEAGKYSLFATAQGYVREGLNEHRGFLTGVAVGSGLDSEHIIFPLHRQAVITGRVTDEHGEAVRHAQVLLLESQNLSGTAGAVMHPQVQTDDLGEFRFARLHPGEYYVAVEANPWYAQPVFNYAPQPVEGVSTLGQGTQKPNPLLDVLYPLTFHPGVTNERAAAGIKLTAGDTVEANIQLQAVPTVHVRVSNVPVDGENAAQFGASEKLFGSMERGIGLNALRIGPGEYELTGLPPGEIAIHVMQNGKMGVQSRTFAANLTGGDTLDAADTGGIANITGRVILPEGNTNAIEGFVMLVREGNPTANAHLQKDGTFSIAPLQEGTYSILVNLQGRDDYVRSVVAKGAKVSGKEITISSAGDVQLSISMGRGMGEVTGVAKLEDKAIGGVMVVLLPESGQDDRENFRMDQSDSDGTFALHGIFPGKYHLVAIEDGWDLEWDNRTVMKGYLEKGQAVEIAANDQKKVEVEVQRKKK